MKKARRDHAPGRAVDPDFWKTAQVVMPSTRRIDDPYWQAIIYELGGWETIELGLKQMRRQQRDDEHIAAYSKKAESDGSEPS